MYRLTSILLHNIEGPVNLGGVCRAMANTGFKNLAFTGELTGREDDARRFAVHAREILDGARIHDDFAALIEDRDMLFGFTPRNPWDDGRGLDLEGFHAAFNLALKHGRRIGLLFGNEQRGLENAQLARCHFRVALPTADEYASMNLAQAVLVVLWELRRRHDAGHLKAGQQVPEIATAEERKALLDNIYRYLETIEFLNPQNPEQIWIEVQPLFASRNWTKRELTLLHAVFGKGRSRYLAALRKQKE
ncbi:MAG: RNA methyltransferase [Acidobacteriota bacterium]|nr:RNA methyltransferase [Acidobacteriota bacterium]